MLNLFKKINYFPDFVSLFYPELCAACGNNLFRNEEVICSFCKIQLPYTHYHHEKDNRVAKLFWGRVNIYSAAACFHFKKGSKVQHLLYQLKYNGRKDVGLKIGTIYAHQLMESEYFSCIDRIIPVPLHKNKKKKRGYNQAALFANGLADGMQKPVDENSLLRSVFTETQTRKSRFDRFENVKEVFLIENAKQMEGQHILLVDDVVTTGSTLEACAEALLQIPEVKVSIATIAIA
jgi:ComF family protein